MKEDNLKSVNLNNVIKEKSNKLNIKAMNVSSNEEKLKNALSPNKISNGEGPTNAITNNTNSNSRKDEENNQNTYNNELNKENSLNSYGNYNNYRRESNLLKFSKLFKIRNELAVLAQNINIGDRNLIKSLENSPKIENRTLLTSPNVGKLPLIINPYHKNKNFKDFVYHNRLFTNPNDYNNANNLQNSISLISSINPNISDSLNSSNQINRKFKNNKLAQIIIPKGKVSPESSRFLNDNILINSLNTKNYKMNNNIINASNKSKNNINALSPKESKNMISIEKYNTVKTETMANYRHDTSSKEDGEDEKGVNKLNKSTSSSNLQNSMSKENSQNINEAIVIQVNIREKSFVNPMDSMDIINTNKFIFDNINSSLYDIQKIYYDKTIKSIQGYYQWKKKMNKVRVSTLVPKNIEAIGFNKKGTSVLTETVNEDPDKENNEDEAENLFGKDRDDYIDKKKEKEKQKQKNLQLKKVKEELKLKNRNMKIGDDSELYASYKYSSKNFPEGREQFAFRYNLVDIVLFGGLIMNKTNNYIWSLEPNTLEWERQSCDNCPIYPRYGHTGILYQKKFIIFGGKIKAGNYQYLADLDIFDLNEKTWSQPTFNSKSFLPLRRNHVAELVGHQIIIHGGMSEDNQVLADCHVLSLNPYKWNYATISDLTPTPALSGHASSLVVPAELKYNARMNIYKFPDVGFGKITSNKIRERGWYLFGGIDMEGNLSNDIYILRLGKKPLEWIKPLVRGQPPKPRYSHSMNYFEEGNFLIVHGGRNDYSSDSFALNDTHIFDLQKMEWQEIKLYSDLPNFDVFHRCGHAGIIYSIINFNSLIF